MSQQTMTTKAGGNRESGFTFGNQRKSKRSKN